ncbi:MAG: 16S rRNA processing protein RimM [Micavibrio aeruginosavorus]|uniref:Ribosome maturation factor RimM n=1 Tax=Micavibrio aeruginosavorus TaxID=349221 RepID=A0A7T5R4L0_9BACT|nr:MAG: 16S rRNA processing protein RimM [Micavibrio aeruginosavorus]
MQTSPRHAPLPEGKGIKKRICLGEISTAHGVRGLVRIRIYGDDPQALSAHGPLFTSETGETSLIVRMKNSANKFWIAEIEGVTDRSAAEALRGTKLWIERSKLPEIENHNEFYYEDLIGMSVETEANGIVGKVIAVDNFGAGDLLEIRPPSGPTFYLPFADEYILEVNMPRNLIKADIPPGLCD